MPFAIGIKAANDTARHIRDLWDRLGGFEDVPSMRALNYPPHITFAVYDRIDGDSLGNSLRNVFAGQSALRLAFERLRYFDSPSLVLWAAPVETPALRRLHQAIRRQIDAALCRPHYRPGAWVPHCTLATRIRDDRRAKALAFVDRPMQPFEVVFDVADCIAFAPVRVIDSCALGNPSNC